MNWVEAVIAIKLLNIEITRIAVTSMDLDRQVVGDESIFGRPCLSEQRGGSLVMRSIDQMCTEEAKRQRALGIGLLR